ncbi:MAG: tetratricopeptide repeat protein [Kofleriaceae bacterium]
MKWFVVVALVACGGSKTAPPLPPLPHAAYAHYLDGKLAGYRDDWPAAAEALADATKAAPDQPVIAVELARAQARAKQVDAAKATLAAARTKWPKHAQVWSASGDLLAATAPAEAIRAYRKAIELEPLDERSYLGLAKLALPADATAVLRRLVKRVPTSVEGHYRLGQRLAVAKQLPAAIAEMRKVLELDPDQIDARLDLARGLRIQGKLDEAVAQTRSAFDRSGQALDLAEELFNLLVEADDRTAALDLLTLLDDERSDTDALAIVARLHRNLGKFDEAKDIAARIAKLDTDLGTLVLAEIEIAAGDPEPAAKRALAVASGAERFAESRRVAAAALLALHEPQQAFDALAAIPDKGTEHATLMAFALVDLGKPAETRAVLAPLGDSAGATFARARVAERAGDAAGALALVESLVRAKPDLVAALNLAGYLLADSGQRLGDAERYLTRARELAPGDAAILDSWGWLQYRKREYRAALRTLDRAVRFSPREPEILVHLAAAMIGAGMPRIAAAVLDRAVAMRPAQQVQNKIDSLRKTLPP